MILEREEGREKERNIGMTEKHLSVASCTHPNQESNPNLSMCPDQELNPEPFGAWNNTPTN